VRIDRDTAMRILTALDRFARTGEGNIQKLEGNTAELRLRVGDDRVRFIENPPARSTFTPSCAAPKPIALFSCVSSLGSRPSGSRVVTSISPLSSFEKFSCRACVLRSARTYIQTYAALIEIHAVLEGKP
jgi:hypothetical protein